MTEITDRHEDLPDRRAAAAAMNRLSHALVRHRADPAVLEMIALEGDRLAQSIEDQPIRERRVELISHPNFDDAVKDGSLSRLMEDGAFVDAFEDSPVSGSANPLNMGLKVGRDGETAVGQVTLAAGWQGAPERSHGGIVRCHSRRGSGGCVADHRGDGIHWRTRGSLRGALSPRCTARVSGREGRGAKAQAVSGVCGQVR